MTTTTLYENGDTFEITYKRAETKEPNKNYIYIDEVLHEVISRVKTNTITITDKMSLDVLPIDELTIEKQIYYIAHNIRNIKTNPNHNPKKSRMRFEQRNYHTNHLQINFSTI